MYDLWWYHYKGSVLVVDKATSRCYVSQEPRYCTECLPTCPSFIAYELRKIGDPKELEYTLGNGLHTGVSPDQPSLIAQTIACCQEDEQQTRRRVGYESTITGRTLNAAQ